MHHFNNRFPSEADLTSSPLIFFPKSVLKENLWR